jgi:hypothetical protein
MNCELKREAILAVIFAGFTLVLFSVFLPSPQHLAPSTLLAGDIPVVTNRPAAATYTASFSVACGGAGDCVTIYGKAPHAQVREIWISKPSAAVTVAIIKRSTADSGGTSSALTAVPHLSSNAAAGSTVLAYTAVPTAGTAVGTLLSQAMATTDTLVQDYGVLGDQTIELISSSEGLCINVSAAVTLNGYIRWTEP